MIRQSPTVAQSGKDGLHRDARAEHAETQPARPQLTNRQTDVIELAMQGLTNDQIAQRLNLSTHAIKFNLSSAYRKLAVANRTQAAVAYLNYRGEGRA